MKSLRYEALLLASVLLALACIASAQFSSEGTIVYLGDLSLVASSHSSDKSAKASSLTAALANNTTQNSTALDNQTINEAWEDGRAPVSLGANQPAKTSPKGVLDLSAYSKDRSKGNLTGYTNIMYPIAGSKGTTTSTSSGGGCCGGG